MRKLNPERSSHLHKVTLEVLRQDLIPGCLTPRLGSFHWLEQPSLRSESKKEQLHTGSLPCLFSTLSATGGGCGAELAQRTEEGNWPARGGDGKRCLSVCLHMRKDTASRDGRSYGSK